MALGRKPGVRYWRRKGGGYFVTVRNVQVELALGPDDAPNGPTYLAALKKYGAMRAMEVGIGTDDYLVSACLNQYRKHLRLSRKHEGAENFDSMAKRFSARFGHLKASALVAGDVQDWLGRQATWNDTSKNHAGRHILGALAWAKKKGYIETDPLAGRLDLPDPVRRGREARMSRELCDLLIREAYAGKGGARSFGDFLAVLHGTGCRPIELRKAEAWNVTGGKIVFRWNATRGYVHKTAKKGQRDRIIYLGDRLAALVDAKAAANPDGPIFRTPRGKPWSSSGIQNKWAWLVGRPAVRQHCRANGLPTPIMYGFRHTWISEFVDATGDVWNCAKMCGTSVAMIESRYGHPDEGKIHDKLRAYLAAHHSSI